MDIATIKKELKGRIAKGLNFGVEAVDEVLQADSDLYNQFILLKSKYNDLMYLSTINTLPYEQIELGLNRLRNHLLSIIDQLEENHLEKKEMAQSYNINDLPTRRANFFKLLDIHYLNLRAITYVEILGADEKNISESREAIFKFYQNHRRQFRNREDLAGEQGAGIVKKHFKDWFGNEIGILEVYFKNIKHLLRYALANEVEQSFFLATLQSLFSRYEQAFIFYYAYCGIDEAFTALVKQGGLVDDSITPLLIRAEDLVGWTKLN